MLRSLLLIAAVTSLTQALSPAQDGDAYFTKTITSTRFICPCDSTALWSSWLGTSSTKRESRSSAFAYNGSTISTSSKTISAPTVSSSTSSITTPTSSSIISTTSAVPSFYFAAYGNGFVADGTSLGDDTSVQYAALNNANTPFYVNSTGALIDSSNGRIAVVQKSAADPVIMFVSQAQFDTQTTSVYATCSCAITTSFLSCNCNGLTAFAAGADTYLHIQASAIAKRDDLVARQATSSGVSMSATPVPSSGDSTSTASVTTLLTTSLTTSTTTLATTTSSCPSPTATFVIVANGSSNVIIPDGGLMTQRTYTYFDTGNQTMALFSNNSDPYLYSLDPCTGYLRENRFGNVAAAYGSSGRYANIQWQSVANASFYFNATFCKGAIGVSNTLKLDCGNGYNQLETDSSGNLQIANVQPNASTGDYVIYPTVRYTSTVPTFATYTTSACASPTPTFNVYSNGSTYSDSLQNKTSPYGTTMWNTPLPSEPDKTVGMFSNETAAFVYTIDPCTGVWTERTSGNNQIATVLNYNQTSIIRWSNPTDVKPDYNAKLCKCSINSATSAVNCDNGYGRQLWALYGDWLYSYAPVRG